MYAPIQPYAGAQPFNDWFTADTTQRHPLGLKLDAIDPFWGFGEFLYIKSNDAILKGSLVNVGDTFLGVLLPNVASQGFPVAVSTTNIPSGSYGWVQLSGKCVYKTNATVAADAVVGITGAGILGAGVTTKFIYNVRNTKSATATVTVNANTVNGNNYVTTNGYDGFFLGMALSGTGIPASTVVAGLGQDGTTIKLGSAIGVFDKLATASGQIVLTGTYTGFGQGIISRPFCQGAV